VIHVINF
jgi:hypothetical protein